MNILLTSLYFLSLPSPSMMPSLLQFKIPNRKMKAVQLIAFDNNKNPFIPPDALALLKTLQTPHLHIISVAGKYRTGKSYILNRVLLNRNQGFSVGHTINACTKGLWMWPELISLNGKDCLIIDTEGLGSLEEGESTDLKIFMLALLFSSQLIYNSLGSIDEQALQSLSLVIQLATLLQRQDKYDTQELVNTFPSFMWLIRDFSLKLENEKGAAITPQEYLELALKHQSRTSQAAERKNQIRKQLRTFFQERDCYALVRPTEEQKDLHNLSSVADSKLRPEFVALIGGLKQRLSENVKPKRVRGKVLSMEGFIQLCQYYTKALVDGKLPTISSHWDNLCLSQTHRIFQKYQLQHLKALQSLEGDVPQMTTTHRLIVKEGMEAIERSFLGKLEKQLFKERFQRKLQNQLQEIKERASCKKTREVKLMLQNIEQQTTTQTDPLMRYESTIIKMSQISENSSKDSNLYCEFYLYLCEFARNLLEECCNKRLEERQFADNKITLLENQLASVKEALEESKVGHQQEILQMKKRLSQLQYLNSRQQSDKQTKCLEEILALRSTVKDLNSQLNDLKEILHSNEYELLTARQRQQLLNTEVFTLTQRLLQKEREICEKDEQVNLLTSRHRIIKRQYDVIKQRYQDNIQENLQMRATIDKLQEQISNLQDKKYSELGVDIQVQQLRRNLKLSEQANKNLSRLLKDQQTTFEAIIKTPQNLNYNAMKMNFDLERTLRDSLQEKIQQINNIMDHCSRMTCSRCASSFPPLYAREHFDRCSRPGEEPSFDVSYSYSSEGEFLFQISISQDLSERIIHRSISEVRQLLTLLGCEPSLLSIFQPQQDDSPHNEAMRQHLDSFLNNSRVNPLLPSYLLP